MPEPEMKPVASSNLAAAGYDETARELYVEFKGGKTYIYSDVGRETFDDLLAASSPGAYLFRFIRNVYAHRQA